MTPALVAVQNLEVALAALVREMECLPPFSQARAERRRRAEQLRDIIRETKAQT